MQTSQPTKGDTKSSTPKQRSWLGVGLSVLLRSIVWLWPWRGKRGDKKAWQESRLSLLYIRLLIVNLIVLLVPVIGFIGADSYRNGLIDVEVDSLRREAVLIANSLGEGAAQAQANGQTELVPSRVTYLAGVLARNTNARLRLFRPDGELLMDSFLMQRNTGFIKISPIRDDQGVPLLSWLFDLGSLLSNTPPYREPIIQRARDYEEVVSSLRGTTDSMVRVDDGGNLVVSVAVPVKQYRAVLGSLLLSRDQTDIEAEVNSLRIFIIQLFLIALAVTLMLSLYQAWAIAHPIRMLALAADQIRTAKARQVEIPDLSMRLDEIGDLSIAMREMAEGLWERLDAIESFAADVSHELKNPLTSLRSAVETAAMIRDPEKFHRLVEIIVKDVERLDRLITDISNASRLDAELSRADARKISLRDMLLAFAESHDLRSDKDRAQLILDVSNSDTLDVTGLEGRLGQVLRNLVGNAESFSPPNSRISLIAERGDEDQVILMVEDEGPGLPPGKEAEIFSRFFTDRPESQGFGNHSGLGLAISQQIVEAHKGVIKAETMYDLDGGPRGARFTIILPAYNVKQRG